MYSEINAVHEAGWDLNAPSISMVWSFLDANSRACKDRDNLELISSPSKPCLQMSQSWKQEESSP